MSEYFGFEKITDRGSENNALSFLIQQRMANANTMRVVKVLSCSNMGNVTPVGVVSVQILVNQIDGIGNPTPHGPIYNIPYTRIQGGTNAIIIDPVAGDIGWMVCEDRDISAVKANKAQSNPGSFRRNSLSDGVYIGGILNGTPVNFIQFQNNNVNITATAAITIKAADLITLTSPEGIIIDGPLVQGKGPNGGAAAMEGPLTVTQDVIFNATTSSITHIHPQGADSHGDTEVDTGPPVPGS